MKQSIKCLVAAFVAIFAVVSASAPSWITAEVIDKNTVKFTVSENTTGAIRSGSISVTGSQSSSSFGINQYGS